MLHFKFDNFEGLCILVVCCLSHVRQLHGTYCGHLSLQSDRKWEKQNCSASSSVRYFEETPTKQAKRHNDGSQSYKEKSSKQKQPANSKVTINPYRTNPLKQGQQQAPCASQKRELLRHLDQQTVPGDTSSIVTWILLCRVCVACRLLEKT